jgi:hypothetical protein
MTHPIYKLTLLTPLFSRGSYDATAADSAEIRAPSIRGQLHHWLRQLNYSPDLERAIFGAVQRGFGGEDKPSASKIVIRVANIQGQRGTPATLPHKPGGQASPKAAHLPGTTFELHVLERLGGLSPEARIAFKQTLDAWLLAGSLGLRSTRAAGAFQWEDAPQDVTTFQRQFAHIVGDSRLNFDVLSPAFPSAEKARETATDTVSHQALASDRFPLGAVKQGFRDNSGAPPRKTSPLRFTVRKFSDGYRIIALWDARTEVTSNNSKDLARAIELLDEGSHLSVPKKIGAMLRNSALMT